MEIPCTSAWPKGGALRSDDARASLDSMVFTALYTGFSSEGRAKLRVGVLNVPWPKNSKPLEVEGNQKAHHNKTPLSSCSSVLNLFLFMFTHLSN